MTEPALDEADLAGLVRTLDRLEANGYVSLDDLRAAGLPDQVFDAAVRADVLLIDYRHRLVDGQVEPVTLCRLNRRHETVHRLLD